MVRHQFLYSKRLILIILAVQRRGAIPASRLATIAKRPEVKHRVNRQKGDWHRWAIVVENPHEDDEAADERGVTRWSSTSSMLVSIVLEVDADLI